MSLYIPKVHILMYPPVIQADPPPFALTSLVDLRVSKLNKKAN